MVELSGLLVTVLLAAAPASGEDRSTPNEGAVVQAVGQTDEASQRVDWRKREEEKRRFEELLREIRELYQRKPNQP